MSKRKPTPSPKAPTGAPKSAPKSGPESAVDSRRRILTLAGLAAAGVATVALVAWLAGRGIGRARGANAWHRRQRPDQRPDRRRDRVPAQPKFTQAIGFSTNALLSTAERAVKGLILYDPQPDGTTRPYQHPTWQAAGYLGRNAIDRDGNIYVAPAPRVNLIDNPPIDQNKIHKVDTSTAVMTELIDLPAVQAPSMSNPYGVLGLTYRLRHTQPVRLVGGRLDAARRERAHLPHRSRHRQGRFGGRRRRRHRRRGIQRFPGELPFFGSARTQEARARWRSTRRNSSHYDAVQFSLQGLGPEGNDKARKITFERGLEMVVNGTKFNYNLAPPPAQQRPTAYRFQYDPEADAWAFQGTGPVLRRASDRSRPTRLLRSACGDATPRRLLVYKLHIGGKTLHNCTCLFEQCCEGHA